MEEYVTRAEFEQQVGQLQAEVRKLRETEPIRITDTILLQTLVTQVGTMATDVGVLKQTVARIESTMATKEDMQTRLTAIAEVQKLILDRLPKPPEI